MRKIGIDCRFANTRSGLGRYTRELVKHLLMRNDGIAYVLFVRSKDEHWLADLQQGSFVPCPLPYPHYSLTEQWRFPSAIRQAKIDLFFATHFNVPFLCPVPFVITIHDLILHRYPNEASFLKQCAYRILFSRAIRRARRIIAVSHFTAKEIGEFYGRRTLKKTDVVYEGVHATFVPQSEDRQREAKMKYHLEKPFFLYVGNAKEHKNLQMLIDAHAGLRSSETDLVLVTEGKEVVRHHYSTNVRLLSSVSDIDLAALYSAARAYVTASLYEGFGLPIAEAQACGCPIIATKSGAIPEIAEPSALLLEPNVQALIEALRNPPRGRIPHSPLSWDECAEETSAILCSAL